MFGETSGREPLKERGAPVQKRSPSGTEPEFGIFNLPGRSYEDRRFRRPRRHRRSGRTPAEPYPPVPHFPFTRFAPGALRESSGFELCNLGHFLTWGHGRPVNIGPKQVGGGKRGGSLPGNGGHL